MSATTFSRLHLVPEGREMLSCSCLVPDGWVQVPLPDEEHDFSNSSVFYPLLLCMAPYGAVVFTIAARPSFDDGTVQDWAEYLATLNNLTLESVKQARIGRTPGIVCDGTMQSEAGVMRLRSVFLEDGGRLYNIGTLAPETIWPSVEPIFNQLIGAFALDESKGLTAQPMRLMTTEAAVEFTTDSTTSTESAPAAPEPTPATTNEQGTNAQDESSAQSASDGPAQPADVALAEDASSLDQEHPMNIRLRDSGAGLVPRIISMATDEKFAIVGAGAIEQMFRVPFGWHVIDDGKRTLVFDAGGSMQINLDLRYATPEQHIPLLQSIGDSLAAENPDALFLKLEMMGMPCLGVRDLLINGEKLDQAYLVRASGRPNMALVCRITANREHITLAVNTAEVILTSLQGPPPVEEEFQGQPAWWRSAVLLERQNMIEEAEQTILKALDHIGVYSSLAYLHELRFARFSEQGKHEEAQAAKARAIHWLYAYAGSATSGGEGAALSLERDQRIAALGGETGAN